MADRLGDCGPVPATGSAGWTVNSIPVKASVSALQRLALNAWWRTSKRCASTTPVNGTLYSMGRTDSIRIASLQG